MDEKDELIRGYNAQKLSQSMIAAALNNKHGISMSRESIGVRLRKMRDRGLLEVGTGEETKVMPVVFEKINTDTTFTVGITKEQLLSKYDLSYIVKNGLNRLRKDIFLSTTDLAKELNIYGRPGYLAAMLSQDNAAYCGRANKDVYWSHPDSIAEMKAKHVLQPVNY